MTDPAARPEPEMERIRERVAYAEYQQSTWAQNYADDVPKLLAEITRLRAALAGVDDAVLHRLIALDSMRREAEHKGLSGRVSEIEADYAALSAIYEALRAAPQAPGVRVPVEHLKEALRFYPAFDHDARTRLIRADLEAMLAAANHPAGGA